MLTVKIDQFKKGITEGQTQATGTCGDCHVTFYFGRVAVGFGYRYYFICPKCGQYRVSLVFNGKAFVCFRCAGINPYSGLQKTTRGGDDFISYKMRRFAEKHKVEDFHFPFCCYDYAPPKRVNWDDWSLSMKVLQALESMRNQSIFLKKIWDAKTIQSVEDGTNPYLKYPLTDLLEYMYPFDGKPIDLRNLSGFNDYKHPPPDEN